MVSDKSSDARIVSDMSGQKPPGAVKLSIWLTVDAKKSLDKFTTRFGGRGSQMTTLSTMVERFAMLPEPAKFAFVGWVPDGMGKAFALVLRELADRLDHANPAAPAVDPQLAHLLTVKKQPLAKPGTGSTQPSSEPASPEEK
jgi:hypothetical protein